MPNKDYLKNYLKDNYKKYTFRIPIEKAHILEELSKEKNTSINQLIILSLENTYNVNLCLKSKDIDRYIIQKAHCLRELHIMDATSATQLLQAEAELGETLEEKIHHIDNVYNKLIQKLS